MEESSQSSANLLARIPKIRTGSVDESPAAHDVSVRATRNPTLLEAGGRGVAIVAKLSSAWGSTPVGDLRGYSKGVWFTVPVAGVENAAWEGDWLEGL